ncbi:MAG: hypothetical protein OXU29_09560, partial [Gammaproteobacteria bacterium]|nr:hypothetical protein [Gammaproteobacteria bacterium]
RRSQRNGHRQPAQRRVAVLSGDSSANIAAHRCAGGSFFGKPGFYLNPGFPPAAAHPRRRC